MEAETIFYVLGGALVLAALALSALGLRNEGFPGARGLQLGVTVAVVALVGAIGAFAWMSAEDEQEHRNAELAEAAEEGAGEEPGATEETPAEAEIDSEAEGEATTEETTAGVDGAALFLDAETGCGGCHQLADAGTEATTGPPLDAALGDQDAAYIETSIVDPNKVIAEGFGPNIMPQGFGEQLAPEELEALVRYLAESTGAKG